MDRIIADLQPISPVAGQEVRRTLAERMAHHKVPGMSVAIIDGGRVVETAGFGLADASTGEKVTPETLFQACSMSKPMAALAVMRAVERGELDLDAPVNRYLKSWQLPSTDSFSADGVTLRRLLSHTAGTSVPGFGGYPLGTAVPTTVEVLDGLAPANSAPVRLTMPPGGQDEYSGGGTTITQLVLEELSGLAADEVYARDALVPLGMSVSTFAQPLPEALRSKAATGHDQAGVPVPGRFHVYPEYGAAGLWTTAADFARYLIGLQEAARTEGGVLSRAGVAAMMTPQPNSTHGIGPEIAGTGETLRFGHSGGNRGFRCDSRAYLHLGKGAVVLVNGEGVANAGWALTRELMNAIARAYDWPDFAKPARLPVTLSADQMAAVVGRYAAGDAEVVVSVQDGGLVSRSTFAGERQVLALSATDFFTAESPYDLRIEMADGRAAAFVIHDNGEIVMRLPRAEA
ncbi:D-aminopeptidase [Alphaproteobacteria bacterium SO-S41]|nr:D-aminopeptidase [Alphaproteobacteria bacterium SO-S41]